MILFEKYKMQKNLYFKQKRYNSFIEIYEFVNSEITNPLNKKIKLRNYQKESLGMFFYHYEEDREKIPVHLLFNMATGSGKTVIMAYLIYFLYKNGYSNFVFLVNSVQILDKTIDNFINKESDKYLFNENININIKKTSSFIDSFFDNTINIKFTTIQGLASEIYTSKENSLDLDSLKNNKVVLLADEAHHLNSDTKKVNYSKDEFLSELDQTEDIDSFIKIQKILNNFGDKEINKKIEKYLKNDKKSWEKCILKVLNSNNNNLLLEFTATIGNDKNVLKKYDNKIIYKYDLKKYREDKFTKEIELIQLSDQEEDFYRDRIILSVLNNIYRQKLFEEIKYTVTPVILFKSKDTEENKLNYYSFLDFIRKLDIQDIKLFVDKYSEIDSDSKKSLNKHISQILNVFEGYENILMSIKTLFNENTVKIVDSKNSKDEDLTYLTKLDSKENKIRAIFQVEMLNEGWDVLSLYDIVRLQDSKNNIKEKTNKIITSPQTVREAQLIGRGARYFPFIFENKTEDKFIRKFDHDIHNQYRILETMFYYSSNDNLYIKELKTAMREQGIDLEDKSKNINLKLKNATIKRAKEDSLYIWVNDIKKSNIKTSLEELKKEVEKYNETFIDTHEYRTIIAMEDNESYSNNNIKTYEGSLRKLGFHKGTIYKALRMDKFFNFDNLKRNIKDIVTINDLILIIESIKLTYSTDNYLNKNEKLKILKNILKRIKDFIKTNTVKKKSKDFKKVKLLDIFSKEKTIKVPLSMREEIKKDNWFSHEAFCGNELEHKLISDFELQLSSELFSEYSNHLLIRNEKELTIYDKKGNAMQPDFVWLFEKNNEQNYYQVFIEPKGSHLIEKDAWKEEFLSSINEKIESDNFIFHILGSNFFKEDDNKDFWLSINKNL